MKQLFDSKELEEQTNEISSMISDDNFLEVSKDLNDGIGSILANTAIAIAEQKKLFQKAKTPSALAEAIKLLAVTSANLMNAGASMMSWMGKQLPQRDSIKDARGDYGLGFLSWLANGLSHRDTIDGKEIILTAKDSKNSYAILKCDAENFAISCNYDFETGLSDSMQYGFRTVDNALTALGEMLNKE